MGEPPRHRPDRGRFGPSVGYLAIACALVAGAVAGAWNGLTPAPADADAVAAGAQATRAAASAASSASWQVATAASAPLAPAPAAPASAPTRIPRVRAADGDQTPDIADYVNDGEKPSMNEVIDRLHQAGVHTGLGAFNPPGTKPVLVGLAVPEDFALPPGYVRHYQATDDGQRVEAILMFAPDFQPRAADGTPLPLPADRVVPPELAPPGLPLRRIAVPTSPHGS